MEQDIKALHTIIEYAFRSTLTAREKSSLVRYKNRLERILSNLSPKSKFKIMIINSKGKLFWGKERIGYIEPVENEQEASYFTREEAEYIETTMMQNGKLKIYKVNIDG